MDTTRESEIKNKRGRLDFGKYRKLMIAVAIILILIIILFFGIRSRLFISTKMTKIGFENIGELATQSAYCTEVCVTDDYRTLYGWNIPFTQSKYIYSYDIVIKAGLDFSQIDWKLEDNTIRVLLPEMKILSCELNPDSLKVYHEAESIYNQISIEDNNEGLKKLRKDAQDNAVKNGLLDNARSNAEIILTGFFGNVYDMEKYKIEFV